MKIAGANIGAGDIEGSDPMRFHVDHAILILQRTFYPEKPAARDDDAIALEGIRGNDDVGDAGFIFERKEDKPLGGSRTLPGDYTACNAHKAVAGRARQLLCRENALGAKSLSLVCHGMRAGGEAGAGVVGSEALVRGHALEGHRRFFVVACVPSILQQRADGPPDFFDLPERIAAMFHLAERIECADACQ